MTNKFKSFLVYSLIFILFSLIFFSLHEYRKPGGDSGQMVELVSAYPRYQYYYRSPGIFMLHQTIYFLFKDYGLSGKDAIAISSSTAGGVFAACILSFSSHPLFLIVNFFSGIIYIFMGHLENYGWVNALLALFFILGIKYTKGRIQFVYVVAAWVLASFMHMLAIFYFPALLYLFLMPSFSPDFSNKEGKKKIRFNLPAKSDIEHSLVVFVVFILMITLLPMFMRERVMMLDVGSLRLVPLFKITNPRHYFTMFSAAHFKMVFFFISQASVLGIPLLILLSGKIRENYHYFVLIGFICGFLWAFIWHPDMGQGDWDLFGSFAIPLNLLVGILIAEKIPIYNYFKIK